MTYYMLEYPSDSDPATRELFPDSILDHPTAEDFINRCAFESGDRVRQFTDGSVQIHAVYAGRVHDHPYAVIRPI